MTRRRFLLAIAISIAIHEIVAGLVRPIQTSAPPVREIVTQVRLTHIAIRPTPRPRATPPPIVPRHVVVRSRIVAEIHAPAHARAIARAHRFTAAALAPSKPVWDVATTASSMPVAAPSGIANGVAVGSGNDPNGSAAAGTGNGDGIAGGDAPCGFVIFSDPHGSRFDPHTHGFWVDIRMSVHLAGGASQSMILDYPWYYPSEASNPWSSRNLHDPNFPTRFQPPPPQKLAAEPPLVRYVIAHSTADGFTLLQDCPPASAPAVKP